MARDDAVLDWFVDHRSAWTIDLARIISTIGSFLSLATLAVIVGLWVWRRGWSPILAVVPLASLIVASLTSTFAKSHYGRERPPVAVHATKVTLAAFPSGHSADSAAFFLAAAFVLALTVATRKWTKVALVAAGAIAAGLVGLSRLVLGVHWLSDVVAGWTLGTAVAVAFLTAAWWATTRSASPPVPHSPRREVTRSTCGTVPKRQEPRRRVRGAGPSGGDRAP